MEETVYLMSVEVRRQLELVLRGKWFRTRTAVNTLLIPVFNEQYRWDVYDTATTLTVAIFDNLQLQLRDRGGGASKQLVHKIHYVLRDRGGGAQGYTPTRTLLVLPASLQNGRAAAGSEIEYLLFIIP